MNAVFHLGALIASLALAWGLLRAQKQRDSLRRLAKALADAGPGLRAVEVEAPAEWLRGFAAALEISFEISSGYRLAPRRVRGWVLFDLFLSRTITLIRCLKPSVGAQADLLVEITTARSSLDPAARAGLEREAAAALGDRVEVRLIEGTQPT